MADSLNLGAIQRLVIELERLNDLGRRLDALLAAMAERQAAQAGLLRAVQATIERPIVSGKWRSLTVDLDVGRLALGGAVVVGLLFAARRLGVDALLVGLLT